MLPIPENPSADGSESIELPLPECPSRPSGEDLSQTDPESVTSEEEEESERRYPSSISIASSCGPQRYPSTISVASSCGSDSLSPAPLCSPDTVEVPLPESLTQQQTRRKSRSVRSLHIGEAGYKGGALDKLKRTKKQYFFEVTNHHRTSPVLVIICREATLRPAHRIVEKGVSLSASSGGKGKSKMINEWSLHEGKSISMVVFPGLKRGIHVFDSRRIYLTVLVRREEAGENVYFCPRRDQPMDIKNFNYDVSDEHFVYVSTYPLCRYDGETVTPHVHVEEEKVASRECADRGRHEDREQIEQACPLFMCCG
mmetsp:Transcript_18798/g.28806  ORF Transcript_18798/g.28806 Transcript_18798/m.28806 type:complete len:313 (+) Transcript_18798:126-1064(+)